MSFAPPASLNLHDTTVSGGRVTSIGGGGIRNFASLTLINSTVRDNVTTVIGGGILNSAGHLTIENSTITGNTTESGGSGGGIAQSSLSAGTCTVTNSTISGNTAALVGGFLSFSGQSVSFTNSTITNNVATDRVGGVAIASTNMVLFHHTIISGNVAPPEATLPREVTLTSAVSLVADDFNIFGIDGDAGVSFTVQTTDTDADGKVDIVPAAGVTIDNILAPLALNAPGLTHTHALVEGSLAVDGILVGSCPATDQRGVARSIDGDDDTVAQCGIGAFELAPPVPPELAHDLAVTNITVPKTITLTAAKPTQTKTVKVQIQNRSAHSEVIPNATVLAEVVSLDLISLGDCPAPAPVLVPPNKFPLTWKSKQKLNVTFDCANDPLKSTAKDPAHEDYAYTATVEHSALNGGLADDHPADDSCPRAPFGTDPYPNGKLKDLGCDEKVTDVVVK